MLQPGTRIERYEVERLLGQGAIAKVYLLRHTTLQTLHALKVVANAGSALRNRLLQEGMLQASLRHPNIVAVTDVLDVDGAPALLMEYIEGPSLQELLARGPLELEQAEAIFRGILAGVGAAHAQGVVHRDLKPANVMMASQDGRWHPKVADFGLAKALEGETPGLIQTRTGATLGTPSYMAPEQIRDAKRADHRADIFALGSVLYELVCGRMAFGHGDVLDIFNAVAKANYTAPESRVRGLPPHILDAIRGCLVVSLEFRIPDCAALEGVLDGEGWLPSGSDTFQTVDDDAPPPPPPRPVGLDRVPGLALRPAEPVPKPPPTLAPAPSVAADPLGSIAPVTMPAPKEPETGGGWVGSWLTGVGLGLGAGGLSLVLVAAAVFYVVGIRPEPEPAEPAEEPVEASVPAERPVETPTPSIPPAAAPRPAKAKKQDHPKVRVAAPSEQAPPAPEDAVEPDPEAESPEASTPPPARVKVTGADKVVLVGSAGRFPPGELPAGRYSVKATFGDETVSNAGSFDIGPGERITLRCDPLFLMCRAD